MCWLCVHGHQLYAENWSGAGHFGRGRGVDMVGFVPNAEQSGLVLFTMNFGSHMFVGLCAIVCAIAMFAYKLDKQTYENIVSELRAAGRAN